MIVVIPSNREINLAYLTPLIESGARFIIVDDSEGSISMNHPQFSVFNWGDRRKRLGRLDVGFPKRNGACRDFGFYIAWEESDPGEIIIALDDDCDVYHKDFAQQVEATLSATARPVASCSGEHLNILDLYEGLESTPFPRGFPYSSRPGYTRATIGAPESRAVTFSLGLWKNVFDINAIDKIKGPPYVHPEIDLSHRSVIIERNKLVSVCSMNMQFRRELIPVVYQLPMHVEVMPGWVIDRYGDIWGGFILKRLMDIRGEAMAVGEPMINHRKEGDYLRNIWQEHICHLANDEFIDVLGMASEKVERGSYLDMMTSLCEQFRSHTHQCSPLLQRYLTHVTEAIEAWTEALSGPKGPPSTRTNNSVSGTT